MEEAGHLETRVRDYAFALAKCGIHPKDAILVAVHPWDIDGAARAGLGAAWINSTGGEYPG